MRQLILVINVFGRHLVSFCLYHSEVASHRHCLFHATEWLVTSSWDELHDQVTIANLIPSSLCIIQYTTYPRMYNHAPVDIGRVFVLVATLKYK